MKQQRAVVYTAMSIPFSIKLGNFLTRRKFEQRHHVVLINVI